MTATTTELRIVPHTPDEVLTFSKELEIPLERAQKISRKREWYVLWEYDYIKKSEAEVS